MKTVYSICFSPTGNTTRIMHALLGSNPHITSRFFDVTLSAHRQEFLEAFHSLECVPDYWVIGCPVYSGQIPTLVREVIKKLDGQHIPTIGLVTYGNKSYGIALEQLHYELRQRNFKVLALGAFVGEHSYSKLFKVACQRPDEWDCLKTQAIGSALFASGYSELMTLPIRSKIDLIARLMPDSGPKPFVIPGLCVDCQVCVNHCPVNAIDPGSKRFKAGKARAQCISCMSCVKKCVRLARSYEIPLAVKYLLDHFYFNKAKSHRNEPFVWTAQQILT